MRRKCTQQTHGPGFKSFTASRMLSQSFPGRAHLEPSPTPQDGSGLESVALDGLSSAPLRGKGFDPSMWRRAERNFRGFSEDEGSGFEGWHLHGQQDSKTLIYIRYSKDSCRAAQVRRQLDTSDVDVTRLSRGPRLHLHCGLPVHAPPSTASYWFIGLDSNMNRLILNIRRPQEWEGRAEAFPNPSPYQDLVSRY